MSTRSILAVASLAILLDASIAYAPPGIGVASWYRDGKVTATGCPFHPEHPSAASLTLPIGAWVRIRNRRNGLFILVQIEDRGPYVPGRVVDLSEGAARQLGMIEPGLVPVTIELLSIEPVHCQ